MSEDDLTVDVSNVHTLDFKNKPTRPPLEKRPRERAACTHLFCGAIVDTDARTIECGRCGHILDPFKVLDALIRDWSTVAYWVDANRKERDELGKEVKRLKAARRRLLKTPAPMVMLPDDDHIPDPEPAF